MSLVVVEWQRSIMKNFRPKNIEIWHFELQTCYIPQKKAKIMYNWDSAIKSTIFCKKKIFFRIFRFSRYVRGWLKIFDVQFFKIFEKKISKMALLGPGKCWKEQSHEKLAHLKHPLRSHERSSTRWGSSNPPPRVK